MFAPQQGLCSMEFVTLEKFTKNSKRRGEKYQDSEEKY